MRLATTEETALQSPASEQDLAELSRLLKDPDERKGYEDKSQEAAPPKGPPAPRPRITLDRSLWRARGKELLRGLRSVKRLVEAVQEAPSSPGSRTGAGPRGWRRRLRGPRRSPGCAAGRDGCAGAGSAAFAADP